MTILDAVDVTRTYGSGEQQVPAVGGITLSVRAGERLSIVGPSGCGKSTLLDILCGLDLPTTGHVLWEGKTSQVRGHIAALPQGGALLPWRTVRDNVALAARIRHVPCRQARHQAEALLTEFGLGEFSTRYPVELSGGMAARVAFLRTILSKRSVLALDEPFAALDAFTREDIQDWLLRALPEQTSLLLVTHDIGEAVLLGTRVLVLSAAPARIVGEISVPKRTDSVDWRSDAAYLATVKQVRRLLRAGRQRDGIS